MHEPEHVWFLNPVAQMSGDMMSGCSSSWRCLIGLRSELCAGKSSSHQRKVSVLSTLWQNHVFIYGKGSFPNCCPSKVRADSISSFFFYFPVDFNQLFLSFLPFIKYLIILKLFKRKIFHLKCSFYWDALFGLLNSYQQIN